MVKTMPNAYNGRMSFFIRFLLVVICLAPMAARGADAPPDLPAAPPDMMQGLEALAQQAPGLPKVTFLQLDPPRTLDERIDRLVQGIAVDIPPEYDQYGYELRRYMATILHPQIFTNQKRLQEEAQNVKNAGIVLRYWKKALRAEIEAIEAEIDKGNVPSSTRSSFNYKKGIVTAFLVESQVWVDNNQKLLDFLLANPRGYSYEAPWLTFHNSEDKKTFIALFRAREEAHAHMVEYVPFAMMVY